MASWPTHGTTNWDTPLKTYIDAATGGGVFFNVKDYGAVGDNSHDDTSAIQDAAAAANVAGGIVWTPPGTYKLTGVIPWYQNVDFWGAGQGSVWRWSTDLGTGVYGLDSYGHQLGYNAAYLYNMHLQGLGNGSIGTAPCQMRGVRPGFNGVVHRCDIHQFHTGVGFRVDHQKIIDSQIHDNFWNVDFEDNPGSLGNQQFIFAQLDGAYQAGVHVGGDNIMDAVLILGGHCGFSPYGYLKTDEADATAASQGFMINCNFLNHSFESIGNGGIVDLSTTGSDGFLNSMTGVVIEAPFYSWGSDYNDSGKSKAWAVKTGVTRNCRIEEWSWPFTTSVGGTGSVSATTDTGFATGAGWTLIGPNGANSVTAGVPAGANWTDGRAIGNIYNAGGSITQGDLLEWTSNGVVRYGTSSNSFAGIADAAASEGTAVLVLRNGTQRVNFAAGTATIGGAITKDASTAYLANFGAGPPTIGVWTGGAGAVGAGLYDIQLQGLG